MSSIRAPYSAIVNVLKRYGPTSVEVLASYIGQRPEETIKYLQTLEEEGVVQIREKDVILTSSKLNS